ncbi:MAG TPA: hypothetical protein VEA92_03575 [Candidatus Paceibacterota bacterium]|nr:hypothetical protein [Candidatus Paceibacterota bacterium]
MNTRTLITIVVIALIAIGGYFFLSNRAAAPTPIEEQVTEPLATEEEPVGDTEYAALVTYTDGGFSPATTQVRVGDTVRFVNNSSRGMWVGVDEHPTHTEYDGTSTREHCADGAATGDVFDMCRQGVPGEFWEFTFTKAGSFDFHNHAQASHGGTIVVSE